MYKHCLGRQKINSRNATLVASGYDGYISTDETSHRKGNNYMLREEAIKKHRAMWNWIAAQIDKGQRTMNISILKAEYLQLLGDYTIDMRLNHNCYLCYYSDDCKSCPLLWPSEAPRLKCELGYKSMNGYSKGLYNKCYNLYSEGDWKLQAKLCRKIANLPERKMSIC